MQKFISSHSNADSRDRMRPERAGNDVNTPNKVRDPQPFSKHTKDCLKFCRRLSNIMLSQLKRQSKIIQNVLKLNVGALATLIPLLDLTPVNILNLEILQLQALFQVWTTSRRCCLITKIRKFA